MAKELEKVIAVLLRPEIKSVGGEIPERLETTADTMTLTETATATAASPERRVDYAHVGYTDAG
jgi:hypothetical protein